MKPFLLLLCFLLTACTTFGGTDLPSHPQSEEEAGAVRQDAEPNSDAGPDSSETDSATPTDAGASEDSAADTGCTLYAHSAGDDAGWSDCTPVGTHTQDEAMAACKAWSAGQYSCIVADGLCATTGVRTATAAPRAWSLTGVVYQYNSGACDNAGVWQ